MGGGGIYCYSSSPTIENCTISGNWADDRGGGIYLYSSSLTGVNNIIRANTAPTGSQIYMYSSSFSCTYSDIEGGWPGVGNIDADPLFVTGPEGDYYLSQIASGQTVNSPCVDAGDPASTMIVGTTRTDGVRDEGIVDMGYHYNLSAAPPAVSITLTPHNPPIVLPGSGGTFEFNIAITNNEPGPVTLEIWTMATLPNGNEYGPIIGPLELTLTGSVTIDRDRTQAVGYAAPAGSYTHDAYVGVYPDTIWDEDHFEFTKVAYDNGGPIVLKWANWGESFDDLTSDAQVLTLEKFALHPAHPNPFNPETNLSFVLPEASYISLIVYDIQGREVVQLVDGWRTAGTHQAVFDGSRLASGMYFARLTAGDFYQTRKLILIK